MRSSEVRKKYLEFFKQREHTVIPSASLVPENDSTTLFTGSGMQPLLPYLLGKKHEGGIRLVNSQKCFRSEDIEEVGDNRHTTFFEMLGNWSLGDYWKEDQLKWFFEFLTKELGISKDRLWVTCFEGDKKLNLPADNESSIIWKELGIPDERIAFYGSEKNWWSRSGTPEKMPVGEPGGPDTEVFYDFGEALHDIEGQKCHPNCDCGRFMEIGNCVFMQYIKKEDGSFEELEQKNVDFGGGLERLTAAANDNQDVFAVDVLDTIIKKVEELSGKSYNHELHRKPFRILADHIRGAVFMIGDGVTPSNTDTGYILRRLIRRAVRYADNLGLGENNLETIAEVAIVGYKDTFSELQERAESIKSEIRQEEERFRKTLQSGLKQFEKLGKSISGKEAFVLFSTYGFPFEMTAELAHEKGVVIEKESFREEMKKHQALSRVGAEQKFKGGLADSSAETTMLHTATHLLLAGLRKYLGDGVHQAGSNITKERTRFDFTHHEKVKRDILDKVEAYVNEAIANKCDVITEEMPKEEAKSSGVEGSFWERYPDTVTVYKVKCDDGAVYSHELCGGPHVKNTDDIKGHFKITKEEAVAAGVRRVKAVLN